MLPVHVVWAWDALDQEKGCRSVNDPSATELGGYSRLVRLLARHPQLSGLVLIGIGLLICKLRIFDVLERLRLSKPVSIGFSLKLAVLGVLSVQLGLVYLLLGAKAVLWFAQNDETRGRVRVPQLIVALTMIGVAGLVYLWFDNELAKYGYKFV